MHFFRMSCVLSEVHDCMTQHFGIEFKTIHKMHVRYDTYDKMICYADICCCGLRQELSSGSKKSDTSEEWRNQSVEDRLEYALVRVR